MTRTINKIPAELDIEESYKVSPYNKNDIMADQVGLGLDHMDLTPHDEELIEVKIQLQGNNDLHFLVRQDKPIQIAPQQYPNRDNLIFNVEPYQMTTKFWFYLVAFNKKDEVVGFWKHDDLPWAESASKSGTELILSSNASSLISLILGIGQAGASIHVVGDRRKKVEQKEEGDGSIRVTKLLPIKKEVVAITEASHVVLS